MSVAPSPATLYSLAPDAQAAGLSPRRLEHLSGVLRADVDAAVVPGAVALIMRGGNFRIASMTKPMTAVAALILMEQGKLVLLDPVARFLPELSAVQVGVESLDAAGERRLTLEPAQRPMTIHDLMRHTAGFTYGQFGDSLVQRAYRAARMIDNQQTNADMVAKLSQLPLAHQPGTTFEYGMSTDVLGRVVEVVAEMPLDRVFREFITRPLGMQDTDFGLRPSEVSRLAEPQQEPSAAHGPAVVPYDPARPAQWYSGGGGLLSTAADYAQFAQMLLNEGEYGVRLLSRKTTRLMLQNHLPDSFGYGPRTADLGMAAPLPQLGQGYGLGVGVRKSLALAPVPGSPGDFYWGGALGPYFWVDPAEELVAVFMLQELNAQRRSRYRSLLRSLVYQALD